MGFERGIVADYATGWMNGNVGQQRLHATEQRVLSAGEQQSVATRVAVTQEALNEAMKQALAASSAKACAASNAKGVLVASGVCYERRGHGREEPDRWRETSAIDWVSNVPHHHDQVAECRGKTPKMSWRTGCDHDDDSGSKQSERGQVQELRGAMRETP